MTTELTGLVPWKPTTKEAYWEMLEILPPAVMTGYGFLVGEPFIHRVCKVTNKFAPAFEAFLELNNKYFVAAEPMTVGEFKTLKPADMPT